MLSKTYQAPWEFIFLYFLEMCRGKYIHQSELCSHWIQVLCNIVITYKYYILSSCTQRPPGLVCDRRLCISVSQIQSLLKERNVLGVQKNARIVRKTLRRLLKDFLSFWCAFFYIIRIKRCSMGLFSIFYGSIYHLTFLPQVQRVQDLSH